MFFRKSEKIGGNRVYDVKHTFNNGNNVVVSYYKGVFTFSVRFKGTYYGITNAKSLTWEERQELYVDDPHAYPRSIFFHGFKKHRYLPTEFNILHLHS